MKIEDSDSYDKEGIVREYFGRDEKEESILYYCTTEDARDKLGNIKFAKPKTYFEIRRIIVTLYKMNKIDRNYFDVSHFHDLMRDYWKTQKRNKRASIGRSII